MSAEDVVERALRDHAGEVSAAPDVEALLARGIRARRRRSVGAVASVVAATVAIGALAIGPVVWRGADPSPVTNSAAPSASAVPNNAGVEWGPDIPFSSLRGVPYAGGVKWPTVDSVASMTIVGGGVVYVLPDRRIIYETWQHESSVIGQAPWYGTDPFDFDVATGARVWARGVVGNPSHDLVAWFETVEGRRGDLVVVKPSTGDELARTAVPGPAGIRASIVALGEDYIYFSAQSEEGRRSSPEPNWGLSWLPSSWPLDDIWSWRWDTGSAPEATGRQVQDVDDVSADIWARTVEPKLHFESRSGKRLSTVISMRDPGLQWRALSPDGRFWFSYGAVRITATGEARTFDPEMDVSNFAWTGPTKVTVLLPRGAMVCDAETITCTKPVALDTGELGLTYRQPPTQ